MYLNIYFPFSKSYTGPEDFFMSCDSLSLSLSLSLTHTVIIRDSWQVYKS